MAMNSCPSSSPISYTWQTFGWLTPAAAARASRWKRLRADSSVSRDRLDRDLPTEALVLGREHDAHAAAPELVQQPVAAQADALSLAGAALQLRRQQAAQQSAQQPLTRWVRRQARRGAVPRVILAHGAGFRAV